jgi:hypothetical protein
MKRIMLGIILIYMLFSAVTVFAAPKVTNNKLSKIQDKQSNLAALKAESKVLEQKMEKNDLILAGLKVESGRAYFHAKNRIKQMLKQKNKLTQASIDASQAAIDSLKQYTDELNNMNYDINMEAINLQDAKTEQNYVLINQTMNGIIQLQLDRINELGKIIDGMNQIAYM